MKKIKTLSLTLGLLMGLGLAIPSAAQERDQSTTQSATGAQEKDQTRARTTSNQTPDQSAQTSSNESRQGRVEAGKKQKVDGVIIRREADNMIIRDRSGAEITVNLSGSTKISERKGNPFRKGKDYSTSSLMRGLLVEVEGRGTDSGAIDAEKVKISEAEYRVARSIESRVDPVENRVGKTEGRMDTAENRLSAAEQNAQRLSGQLEELAAVANTAKGGAKAAQETADKAIAEVNVANERITATNDRINAVDDYEVKNSINVTFKVNSAVLSDDAKAALDEVANQAKNEKGYVIQVAGFASADGSEGANRRLSERRANAVVRYLVENHDISQRRIVTPFGYGELKPAADNTTREGRQQNRRVEVAILVSKGLTNSTPAAGASTSGQSTSNVNQ